MLYYIVCVSCNELVIFDSYVFACLFIKGKVTLVDSNGRSAWIVYRVSCMLICRSKPRSRYRVREVSFHKIVNLSSNVDFVPETVEIIIINSEFVCLDFFKYSNSIEALRYRCANLNRSVCCLVLPVVEHFTFDERIIRECRYLIANRKFNEVLRLLGNYSSLIVFHKEFNCDLALKICMKGKVFIYC